MFLVVSSDQPKRNVDSGARFVYPKERRHHLDGYSCVDAEERVAENQQIQDERRRKRTEQIEREEKARIDEKRNRDQARRRVEEYRTTGAQRRKQVLEKNTGISRF